VSASFSRYLAAGVAVFAAAAAIVAAPACIPDLRITQLPDAAPPTSPSCGNGFVDLAAGEQCDPGEAGATGCSARCTIACADGGFVDDASGHCYFAIAGAQNYANAAGACLVASAHLVTFASDGELRAVAAWNATRGDAAFWVGLRSTANVGWLPYYGIDEPGWVASCPGCYAADVPGLPSNFPEPRDAATPCLDVPPSTSPWNRAACNETRVSVCEREPPGLLSQPCNGGICIDVRRTFGAKRYLFIATKSKGDDAARFCAQFPAGSLVMFDSREEREQLWLELAKADGDLSEIWIGVARADGGSDWQWDDGAPLDGGRPSPWGTAPIDGGASRAFMQRLEGVVDSQLAHNVDRFGPAVPTELPFVCQMAPSTDAGAP